MKLKPLVPALSIIFLLFCENSYEQQPSYPLPDNFQFDYEVVQVSSSKKNASDTTTIHYLYTKSGDYAALKASGRRGKQSLIVLTKEGISIIFDDEKKNITIINMKNMMGDFMNMAKGMKKDSMMAHHKDKFDPSRFTSEKTGNTKKIGSYTTEEYKVSDSGKYKASIWYAKVDFNTQLSYLFGMGAGNMMRAGAGGMASNPLLQTIVEPKTLMTEIVSADPGDGKAISLYTKSIETVSTSVPTKGYKVNDMSNMDMKQMIEQGTKQHRE